MTRTQIAWLTEERDRADFFEATVKAGAYPKDVYNWLSNEVAPRLKRAGRVFAHCLPDPVGSAERERLAKLHVTPCDYFTWHREDEETRMLAFRPGDLARMIAAVKAEVITRTLAREELDAKIGPLRKPKA